MFSESRPGTALLGPTPVALALKFLWGHVETSGALRASLNNAVFVFHVLAYKKVWLVKWPYFYTWPYFYIQDIHMLHIIYVHVALPVMTVMMLWYGQCDSTLVVSFNGHCVVFFNGHFVVFLCAMTALLPTDFDKSFLLKLSECCMTSCSKCRHPLTILVFASGRETVRVKRHMLKLLRNGLLRYILYTCPNL